MSMQEAAVLSSELHEIRAEIEQIVTEGKGTRYDGKPSRHVVLSRREKEIVEEMHGLQPMQ